MEKKQEPHDIMDGDLDDEIAAWLSKQSTKGRAECLKKCTFEGFRRSDGTWDIVDLLDSDPASGAPSRADRTP